MKYRDLVVVVCLIAVAAAWWQTKTEPPLAASAAPSPSSTMTAVTPTPASTPPLLQASPELQETPEPKERAFQRIPAPQLTLEVKNPDEEFFQLILQARLKTSREMVVPMIDQHTPRSSLSITVGEKSWDFQYSGTSRTPERVLKKGEELSWDIPLHSLIPPKDNAELASLYKKDPMRLSLMVVEGSEDPNPYSRRLMMTVHGELTLTP